MKTAFLQRLQHFSSKKTKNVYDEKCLKILTLQCYCKIVENVRFSF